MRMGVGGAGWGKPWSFLIEKLTAFTKEHQGVRAGVESDCLGSLEGFYWPSLESSDHQNEQEYQEL